MRAELVAVGSELLLGDAVDTNSGEVSARLAEIGVDVHRHLTVGDNPERLVTALGEAVARADAVVVTGGLGPTQDDLTREAVAAVAGVALERREELVEYLYGYFARMGRDMPERNLVQADLPVGAAILPAVGTAAGFSVEVARPDGGVAVVYCLPGVPHEMRVMLERDVVPDLSRRGGLACTVSRLVRTAGISEAAVADACGPVLERLQAAGNPTIAFLASGGETRVRITAKAPTREEALALSEPVVAEVVERLGTAVGGLDDEGVEHAIARLLLRMGLTLAVGESVTGGGVGARLVRVPGASDWFRGGLVTYATETKERVAGVPAALLAEEGPVSERTAVALAEGARERLGAEVGLGIVGVAGPATQGDQPVGTICVAVVMPAAAARSRTVRVPTRARDEIQTFAASGALDYLRRRLTDLP